MTRIDRSSGIFLHDPEDAPIGLQLTQDAVPRLGRIV
jgi:hypothetical protein